MRHNCLIGKHCKVTPDFIENFGAQLPTPIWIDDRRPGATPRSEYLFLHGSDLTSEHCFKQAPARLDDGLIRCCHLTERGRQFVLKYTRPVEHGGEGWLLVTIRFDYEALLARFKDRGR